MQASRTGTLVSRLFRLHVERCLRVKRPSASFSTKLAEVGRFDEPKIGTDYLSGQLFLHRIFGYRGVILFSWTAKVYDRDLLKSVDSPPSTIENAVADEEDEARSSSTYVAGNDSPSMSQTYYQTLIDSQDWHHSRAQSEVTFLGKRGENSLYTIPGLDYVSHEDILPYSVASDASAHPIDHHLFAKFLLYNPQKAIGPPYDVGKTLVAWMVKNRPWLELSDVYRQTTENIRVTAIPFYMGAVCGDKINSVVHWWRYSVRLENLGDQKVTLRERHWRIFSLAGTLETVRGKGVVGKEPILSQSSPAFQYSSHVSIQSPSGHMWGTFHMERENGTMFECNIPPFILESQHDGPDEDNTEQL